MQLFLQTLWQFLSWGNFTGVSIEVPQQKRGFMLHKPLSLKNFLIISSSYYFSSSLNAFTQCFHQNIQNSFHLSVHYAEKLASSQFCIYKIHWPVKGRNVHSRYEHLSRTEELTDVLKFCFFSLNTYNFYSFPIKLCKWRGTYCIWIFLNRYKLPLENRSSKTARITCVFLIIFLFIVLKRCFPIFYNNYPVNQ